jgi:hypothetical protein
VLLKLLCGLNTLYNYVNIEFESFFLHQTGSTRLDIVLVVNIFAIKSSDLMYQFAYKTSIELITI